MATETKSERIAPAGGSEIPIGGNETPAEKTPAGGPAGGAGEEEGRMGALAVYVLYLASVFLALLTALPGLVIAYVFRGQGAAWVRPHWDYQIAIFWRGAIYAVVIGLVGVGLTVVSLGVLYPVLLLAYLGWAVWLTVRVALGLRAWNLRQPIGFGKGPQLPREAP